MITFHTKKVLILLIVLVTIAVLDYTYMFWQLKAKNERISILHNSIDAENRKEFRADSTKDIVDNVSEDAATLNSYIVGKDEEVVTFLKLIETLGKESGVAVTVESVNVGETATTTENYQPLRLSVLSEGSRAGVNHFLALLETMPYKMEVTNASLGSDGVALWRSKFEFEVMQKK